MRKIKRSARIIALAIAFTNTTMAVAQINKCLDRDGRVSYSDMTCQNPSTTEGSDDNVVQSNIPMLPSETAPEIGVNGQNVWTNHPIKPVRFSTDIETVSHAREALTSLDRERTSTPIQKLANYR